MSRCPISLVLLFTLSLPVTPINVNYGAGAVLLAAAEVLQFSDEELRTSMEPRSR